MLAGIWQLSYSGGNFLGPLVSGVLVEFLGFRATSTVFFALYAAAAVLYPLLEWLLLLLDANAAAGNRDKKKYAAVVMDLVRSNDA